MQILFLKKREERRLRAGHLWVFSNEVDTRRSPLNAFVPGEAVDIRDANDGSLGTGYVNPASLIAARLVSHRSGEPLDGAMLRTRLVRALNLREQLFSVPYYRLCHGEGDWLPGLVVDRYGDLFSVQITTAGMEAHKATLLQVLEDLFRPAGVLFRNDVAVRELEQLPLTVETGLGQVPERVEVLESGSRFAVSLLSGQKTGWFYDQRPNRVEAARYARGKAVLDAFCYVGAFGILAAQAGASEVCFLDASAQALELARHNLAANSDGTPGAFEAGDAPESLLRLRESGRRFGLVCLDPPAFIKRRKDAEQGLNAYRRVNDLGLQLLEDGGILMSCSCSHHLEPEALRRLLTRLAAKRGLQTQIIHLGMQGPDHPVHPAMPETAYLKTVALRVWRSSRETRNINPD